MKIQAFVFVAISLLSLTACNNTTTTPKEVVAPIDTVDAVKINGLWVKPKELFIFNSVEKSGNDTLYLTTCGNYVYEPFGTIKSDTNLATSLLKNMKVVSLLSDTFTNAQLCDYRLYTQQVKLQNQNDSLRLFLDNDPFASRHGYISGGEITSNNFLFDEGIKIGMPLSDFYAAFFDVFPDELQNQFSVIVFEPCVVDTRHIYTFKNKKLLSVRFVS